MIYQIIFCTFIKKQKMDFQIRLSTGKILRGIIKSPGEKIRAGIILIHGIGEHVGRYSHWIDRLCENGYGFVGVDLPGHGRSDGIRGHIRNYSLTDEMLDFLIAEYKKTFPGIPVFIYGHSLGGGIVLQYILSKNPDIKGAIVTSPWLRLSFEPDRKKVILARVIKNLLPSLIQPSGLIVKYISHDQKVVDAYISDPLNHDKISVGLFSSAVSAAQYSLRHAGELKIPLLLMHGSDDQLTSPQGCRDFAAKTKMAELKIWDGGYHELHNEPFKEEVFSYIAKWLEKQI
jgi:alpha-beta hydrolase superfamily lysophospholipase